MNVNTIPTNITGNTLKDGDIAGRDIHKSSYTINPFPLGGQSQLEFLYKKLEEERKQSPEFNKIVEELLHFKECVHEEKENVIGLEKKLENGNRLIFLEFAEKVKEKFSKKLLNNENSETAQCIYAFLLAKIYTTFETHIYPELNKNHDDSYISNLIDVCIIKPIEQLLGENLLRIFDDEIYGMIYFLTGNCHIKWN